VTAYDTHSTACRALNEAFEDCHGYSAEDFRAVFSGRLASLLGMPTDYGCHMRPLAPRMTAQQVRSLIYPVVDKMLPQATAIDLMQQIDNAMALSNHPMARAAKDHP
jgi:hypothetical protein